MSKWKERIPGIVISVILVAVFAVFMVILLQSKMVPTKLLILGGIALVLLVASAVLLVRSIRNKGQFICGAALSLVLALVLGLASNYISVATGTLTEIGAVRTEYTPVAVYVRTDDPASALEDTKGYTFGILESLDRESTDSAVSQITERFGSAVTTKTYAGITQLIDGLLNKECGAIILNTAYLDVVTELDKYADVESKIRELEVLHVETAVQSAAEKTQSTGNSDASQFSTMFSTDLLGELMEFLGIYGISDSMQTTIEMVSDNIFGIVWNSGIQILIFLAALQNIPVSAKEAAQMEGATAWEYFWKITLPYVSPMILACFIFTIIDSFTDPNNVVMGRILDLQSDWQYGPASAMAWVYFAIVLAAVGIITAILNKFIYYEVD